MEPAINSYLDESFEDYAVSGDQVVTYKKAGERRLFTNPDVDEIRGYFREHKSRRLTNKVTTPQEAVSRLIADGDYLAVGGFSTTRKPVALLHEIMRQKKRNLGYSGHTTTHDLQLLIAGKCINRCDVAYVVTLEARGFSLIMRKAFENGELEVTEWTNGTLAWRFKAAAMGIPFVPSMRPNLMEYPKLHSQNHQCQLYTLNLLSLHLLLLHLYHQEIATSHHRSHAILIRYSLFSPQYS